MSSFTPRSWKSQAQPQVERPAAPPLPPRGEVETNNLPIASTEFIGRERDVAAVKKLLERHRLVTLVGSGGVGKTRLAVQVGADLLEGYADGVWFVDLAPITDSELVSSVIAQTLSMSQHEGHRVDESIPVWLKRKKLLLIFDNCEHVMETVASIAAAILRVAPNVRIMSTSRQPLEIAGEKISRVASLEVPQRIVDLTPSAVVGFGAVALFVNRASLVDETFTLTEDTAPIVADICRRLDGIPLAIELAAARVKVLSIPHLAERLNERFKLLTSGSRDVLPRQKTLHAMIDWSYNLLTPHEQLLFARLGIFGGSFGLDAATNICSVDGLDDLDVLDLLSSLVDKSLVVAHAGGERERYRLLESMAAYALEELKTLGDRDQLARRHAQHFCGQAQAADDGFRLRAMLTWLGEVELDLDNYRAALEWALTQGNDAVLGGVLAGALSAFWSNGGLGAEGRYWTKLALERTSEAEEPHIVARLLLSLSGLSWGTRSGFDAAERSLALYATAGDRLGAARARMAVAWALFMMGRLDEASAAVAQAREAWLECGDGDQVTHCLILQAGIEADRGDFRLGRELYARALAALKDCNDKFGEAVVLTNLAELEFADGHPDQSLPFVTHALEIWSREKHTTNTAIAHSNRATYCIALGDLTAAHEAARNALHHARTEQHEGLMASSLEVFALLAALGDDPQRGARLHGYVDAQFQRLGKERTRAAKTIYQKLVSALHETLSENDIANIASEGASWSEDRAVEEALHV